MSEHPSKTQLSRYAGRTLEADELLAVDRHLASCDACHSQLTGSLPGGVNVSAPLYQAAEEPFHLDYDQYLKPFVDGQLNEINREIVESHVALCSACADELQDLQAFSRQPVQTKVAASVSQAPWKQWLPPLPGLLNPRLAVAFVVVVFLLGITLAVLMWTMRPASGPVEQAGHTPTPDVKQPTITFGVESPTPQAAEQPENNNTAKPAGQPEKQAENPRPRSEESLLALNDNGQQVTLNKRGQMVGLEELPADLRNTVAHVLTIRRFDVSPGLRDLQETSQRLRGSLEDKNALQALAPAGVVVESDRPVFRWRALEGAVDYIVRIYDSKLRDIESSGPLAGTEWRISRPLERGVTYSWQIRAVKDGQTVIAPKPPAPEARFRILDQDAAEALENAKRLHRTSHLAMGVLYWKHGLIDEAERELQALVSANPDSPVAARLLESLR